MSERDELQTRIDELEAELSYLTDNENTDEFDEYIDEITPTFEVFGMHYTPSRILKELDPIAYDCCFNDFNDPKISELETEITELKNQLATLEE